MHYLAIYMADGQASTETGWMEIPNIEIPTIPSWMSAITGMSTEDARAAESSTMRGAAAAQVQACAAAQMHPRPWPGGKRCVCILRFTWPARLGHAGMEGAPQARVGLLGAQRQP